MNASEIVGAAIALIAVTSYIMNVVYAAIVADEKGFSNNGPIFLAMFIGPLVWLYLIARPRTPKREAQHQLNVADWVAEIEREEAEESD